MASVSRADPFLLPHLVLGRSSICADCCMEWSNHCFLSTIQSSLSSFTSVAITWSSRNTTQPREGPTDLTRNVAGSSEKKKNCSGHEAIIQKGWLPIQPYFCTLTYVQLCAQPVPLAECLRWYPCIFLPHLQLFLSTSLILSWKWYCSDIVPLFWKP